MCKTITDSAAFADCRDMPVNVDEYYNDCLYEACKYDVTLHFLTLTKNYRKCKRIFLFDKCTIAQYV